MRALLLIAIAWMPATAADIHHISLHGQSLCLGFGEYAPLELSQPFANKLLSLDGMTISPLIEDSGNVSGVNFWQETPMSPMANQLASMRAGYAVLTEPWDCQGGIAYSGLKKGTTPYANWLNAMQHAPATVAAAPYGLTYRYAGFTVYHGETDYNNRVSATTYAGYLAEWRSDLEADVHATTGTTDTIPMLVTQWNAWTYVGTTAGGGAPVARQPIGCAYSGSPCDGTQTRSTPLGILDAARTYTGLIYFAGPTYATHYAHPSDNVHLDQHGYQVMGEYAGKAWKRILVDGQYWTGLVPRSISISGATVTLQLWVPSGAIVFDTTTLPEATYCDGVTTSDPAACTAGGGFWVNQGFEWWDSTGTSKPYISAVAITASDTVTLTLSSTPTGSNQRLRHAFTGSGTWTGNKATAAHGNIRDTDLTVGYGSGEHLYNWLATFDDPMGFSWDKPADSGPPGPPTGTVPTITTASLASGIVGISYAQTLTATGDAPIVWSIVAGTLPSWASLNASGAITGTPNAAATSSFTVRARNVNGTADKALSIAIGAAGTGGTVLRGVARGIIR
jgi:hypothetical protein